MWFGIKMGFVVCLVWKINKFSLIYFLQNRDDNSICITWLLSVLNELYM